MPLEGTVLCRHFRQLPPEGVGREAGIECDFFFKQLKARLPKSLVYKYHDSQPCACSLRSWGVRAGALAQRGQEWSSEGAAVAGAAFEVEEVFCWVLHLDT